MSHDRDWNKGWDEPVRKYVVPEQGKSVPKIPSPEELLLKRSAEDLESVYEIVRNASEFLEKWYVGEIIGYYVTFPLTRIHINKIMELFQKAGWTVEYNHGCFLFSGGV